MGSIHVTKSKSVRGNPISGQKQIFKSAAQTSASSISRSSIFKWSFTSVLLGAITKSSNDFPGRGASRPGGLPWGFKLWFTCCLNLKNTPRWGTYLGSLMMPSKNSSEPKEHLWVALLKIFCLTWNRVSSQKYRFDYINGPHKQYIQVDTIFNYMFHVGLPGNVFT